MFQVMLRRMIGTYAFKKIMVSGMKAFAQSTKTDFDDKMIPVVDALLLGDTCAIKKSALKK